MKLVRVFLVLVLFFLNCSIFADPSKQKNMPDESTSIGILSAFTGCFGAVGSATVACLLTSNPYFIFTALVSGGVICGSAPKAVKTTYRKCNRNKNKGDSERGNPKALEDSRSFLSSDFSKKKNYESLNSGKQ